MRLYRKGGQWRHRTGYQPLLSEQSVRAQRPNVEKARPIARPSKTLNRTARACVEMEHLRREAARKLR